MNDNLTDRIRAAQNDPVRLWTACQETLESDDWQDRKQAIAAISRVSQPRIILPKILDAIEDQENASLRNAALEILENFGPRVVPDLVQQAEQSDPETRKFLVDVLGLIGSPIAVPRLAAMLNDFDANIRFAAAEALGRISTPIAAEALFQHLPAARESTEQFVTLQSLSLCIRKGSLKGFDLTVIRPLKSDPLLTRPLLELLGALRDRQSIEFLWEWIPELQQLRVQELCRFLGNLDPEFLVETSHSAGIPDVSVGPDAILSLLSAIDRDVRAGAVWLAVWSGNLTVLADPFLDELVPENHMSAAAEFGTPEDGASFARLLDKAGEAQTATLIITLGRLRAVDQFPAIARAAKRIPTIRPLAFRWGAQMGHDQVIDWLVSLLGSSDAIDDIVAGLEHLLPAHHGRILALLEPWSESIEASREWRTFLILVERLNLVELRGRVELAWKRADPDLRAAALNVLARFRLEYAQHYLSMALSDESETVRVTAAEILADIADENYEKEIRALARDRNPWIRAEALRTMLRLQGDRSIPQLLDGLNDDDVVRMQAIRGLRNLQKSEFAPLLRPLMIGQSIDVAAEAVRFMQVTGVRPEPEDTSLLTHEHWRIRLEAILWFSRFPEERDRVQDLLVTEEDTDIRSIGLQGLIR